MENASRMTRIVDAHARVLEKVLETIGLWRVAQRIRRKLSRYIPLEPRQCEKLKAWIQAHLDLDLTVQRLVQYQWKQEYPPDESASLTSELSSDGDLVSLEYKIAAYRHCASVMQRVLQIELDSFPNGPVKRAIRSLRRNTQWDNSEWVRAQCAERGGCCARQCGCCQAPRRGVAVKGIGHCTSACLCCQNDRGFPIDTSEGDLLGPFRAAGVLNVHDPNLQDPWLKAFVWGL
ncbi:hypothetical protein P170DRAFT_471367 [Aspergillus steynii IBT 23096]|uniref:Uncharacterized protein n=1 Tax=Aspergillus steynii IBT 23096 TaxID=1392250 RepID=A0A2I2GEW7_9EURO|nr:uncharacterized protein P170DRAFT_471367 [Aspergillus steynii IBT 23096]PLB51434.1 hypothetical protein P170DRAFT_471367 [Aspergillus steynii IBT 23096]